MYLYWEVDSFKMTFRETDIQDLPRCVQNYLVETGVIGTETIENVILKQEGVFHVNGKKWTRMKARQFVDVKKCNFTWNAKAGPIRVEDRYVDGRGSLTVKLLGLIPIGKMEGREVDQGEISRFLAESIWYPTAFGEDYMNWKEIHDSKAEATLRYDGSKSVSLVFEFNGQNLIESITGKRFREQKGSFHLSDWKISGFQYAVFNGIKIPFKAEVAWQIDGEHLPYYKLEITEIKYNNQ